VAGERAATAAALNTAFDGGDATHIQDELDAEQRRERSADAAYWAPLRAELERLGHAVARGEPPMGWPPKEARK